MVRIGGCRAVYTLYFPTFFKLGYLTDEYLYIVFWFSAYEAMLPTIAPATYFLSLISLLLSDMRISPCITIAAIPKLNPRGTQQ